MTTTTLEQRDLTVRTIVNLLTMRMYDEDNATTLVTNSTLIADGLRDIKVRDTVLFDLMQDSHLWAEAGPRLAFVAQRLTAQGEPHHDGLPAVASLVAILAWQCDIPQLAAPFLSLALSLDPAYNLALLVSTTWAAGLPAEVWRESITNGITRAQCLGDQSIHA